MDFSITGSDVWESTPNQDEFIQTYFHGNESKKKVYSKEIRKKKQRKELLKTKTSSDTTSTKEKTHMQKIISSSPHSERQPNTNRPKDEPEDESVPLVPQNGKKQRKKRKTEPLKTKLYSSEKTSGVDTYHKQEQNVKSFDDVCTVPKKVRKRNKRKSKLAESIPSPDTNEYVSNLVVNLNQEKSNEHDINVKNFEDGNKVPNKIRKRNKRKNKPAESLSLSSENANEDNSDFEACSNQGKSYELCQNVKNMGVGYKVPNKVSKRNKRKNKPAQSVSLLSETANENSSSFEVSSNKDKSNMNFKNIHSEDLTKPSSNICKIKIKSKLSNRGSDKNDVSDSEDDDSIREAIKEFSFFKKLQKMSKKIVECNSDDLEDESSDEETDTDSGDSSNEEEKTQSDDSLTEQSKQPVIKVETKILKSIPISKAEEKLQSAKFRYLNEKLYTESGQESFKYFQENVNDYHNYHQGFSQQVQKWPMNPVDKIIKELQKQKPNTVVADLGCGDAKIAQTLSHKFKVHSFDLVPLNTFVKACNISKVPLKKESVDIVVFCLSLMGVNLKEYLCEAHRILKIGGILKIAEVESRIEDANKFIRNLKPLGFSLRNQNLEHRIFIFFDFKKEKANIKRSKVPEITLKPCQYKKR